MFTHMISQIESAILGRTMAGTSPDAIAAALRCPVEAVHAILHDYQIRLGCKTPAELCARLIVMLEQRNLIPADCADASNRAFLSHFLPE